MSAKLLLMAFLALASSIPCAQASNHSHEDAVKVFIFKDARGHVIEISERSAMIDGKKYLGTSCSNARIHCVKYSHAFAIIAPKQCSLFSTMKWSADGIQSVILAAAPPEAADFTLLMSTSYAGMVAYTYGTKNGISELYYARGISIGTRKVWSHLDIAVDSIVYRTGSSGFFACR